MASNKQILRILAHNVHDTAALTATSEALPITNTQRSERPLVWRSADLSEQVITGTLSAGAVVDCFAIARHNLGGSGLRRIELLRHDAVVYDSADSDGSTFIPAGTWRAGIDPWGMSYIPTAILIPAGIWQAGVDPWGGSYNDQLPNNTPMTVQWMDQKYLITGYRLTLAGSDRDGFMEIGRIFLGESFVPQVNFGWSPTVEWLESGEHIVTEGGSLRTVGGGELRRKTSIQLDWLVDTDRTQLISLLGKAGMGADLLISLYPDSQSQMLELEGMFICRREQALKTTHNLPGNWQAPLTLLEI